ALPILILKRQTSGACDVGFAAAVGAAHANAQSLDLTPAVVDQVQPRPPGAGRQPANYDLAPVHAERSLIVGQLTADLEGEGARIRGFLARVLRRADPDIDLESRQR